MADTIAIALDDALALAHRAAKAAGASDAAADAIARATVAAEADGQVSVGFAHFLDYLDSFAAGRIAGAAEPVITRPAPAIVMSDARGGLAHLGFDRAEAQLVEAAKTYGIALFAQNNAFTCGSLGYFAARLAERGLVAIAATNSPPLMAGAGSTRATYGTNPMAFAAPVAGRPPLLIDQASSATAFVNVRKAAEEGRSIPAGWALDAYGNPTTDASKAVEGVLLAAGGARGANVALMIEVLSAGLANANWSVDAPSFVSGSRGPGVGMTVIAIAPALFGAGFGERLASQLDRLSGEYGVHIPGRAKAEARARAERDGLRIARAIYDRVAAIADGTL